VGNKTLVQPGFQLPATIRNTWTLCSCATLYAFSLAAPAFQHKSTDPLVRPARGGISKVHHLMCLAITFAFGPSLPSQKLVCAARCIFVPLPPVSPTQPRGLLPFWDIDRVVNKRAKFAAALRRWQRIGGTNIYYIIVFLIFLLRILKESLNIPCVAP
jgi:hypothetical protein